MSYAFQTLVHERQRYFAGVLAVTFSAVLIALQCGLLLGLFKITSIPIDHTRVNKAHMVWVGSKAVPSVDLGKPIPESYITRVAGAPGTDHSMPEVFIANFANFNKPTGGTELCFLLGSRMDEAAVGDSDVLTPDLRVALTEEFAIALDESDAKRLALDSPEGEPKINGKKVKVVGYVQGLKSLAAPWVFCSSSTAKKLMGPFLPADHVSYLLVDCKSPERANEVAKYLQDMYPDMGVATGAQFSFKTREYWLTKTKAGIAIGYAALLGLIVGAVITAQTLYSATMASAKEFAILLALGIPRWRISWMVLTQSFWVGLIGVTLAYPICQGLRLLAAQFNAEVDLRWEVLAGTAVVTMVTAIGAGAWAVRSVRKIEPMSLLR
jgi:putative ABC transport system permease protein